MKKFGIWIALLLAGAAATAQQRFELELWPGGAAESNGLTEAVTPGNPGWITNVTEARLYVYLPTAETATGQMMVVCPGGGYSGVSISHEGHLAAEWLSARGVAAVVLKYRMPAGNYTIPVKDVLRTIEICRERAGEWNIRTNQVGVMGFSAGGHLASTAATHFTSEKNRPDFAALIYPVITMDEQYTHAGSREGLLGPNPSEGLVAAFSNELRVGDNTPPVFIAFSDDDGLVPTPNGTMFYNAMKARNRPAELHIYPSGGHGWGWGEWFKYRSEFIASFERWLGEQMQ